MLDLLGSLYNFRGDYVRTEPLFQRSQTDVAVDPDKNIVLHGSFTGSVGSGGEALTSEGETALFFAAFAP